MKHLFTSLALCTLAAAATAAPAGEAAPAISRRGVEAHLAFLASDALEGREAGQRGGRVAAEYIKAVLSEAGIAPFYDSYLQPFEAYSPAREKGKEFQVQPDSSARYKQARYHRRLPLQNVIGYIEGQRKDEYVLIGAHYDHLGLDPLLVGDQIYNGADDNAASVAVVLQVAKAIAAAGKKPLRSIIFALWDGEEVNYLGSEYFAASFAPPAAAIKAYINLDMVGREGALPTFYPKFVLPPEASQPFAHDSKVYVLHSDSLAKFARRLPDEIAAQQLNLTPQYGLIIPASHGSDDLSFTQRGIPALWFFTGLHPDYHTPADDLSGINWDKLVGIARLTQFSLWELAN